MNALNWFVLLLALAFINTVMSAVGIKKFLAVHPLIDSGQALESFKQMVRRQMYQTLIQIGVLIAANILALYGLFTGQINLLIVFLLNGVIFVMSKALKGFEAKAKDLEVSDASLKNQYEKICETWVKKPLPNF